MDLKSIIKAEASNLGFNDTGFCLPEPPPHYAVFQNWIASGYHASMHYLSRMDAIEKRYDPKRLFPPVKTIIVFSHPYPSNPGSNIDKIDFPYGCISSYAWVPDYHQFIFDKIETLIQSIQKRLALPLQYKICIDSSPILEKDFAQQAGLGWIGKNTCLISKKNGSSNFLAEVLLDLEVLPDERFEREFCGTCQRCIDSCPTKCILENRTIDSSRCISYLTIENRELIPLHLRNAIGKNVFGCDICQIVCPWNKSQQTDFIKKQNMINSLNLLDELSISPKDFKNKFRNSSLSRPGWKGYIRNILTVLGNYGKVESIGSIHTFLKNSDIEILRAHAAWALGQIGTLQCRQILEEIIKTESSQLVIEEINLAMMIK